SALRRRNETDSFGSAFHAYSPRARVQKKSVDESEPSRTEAKSQTFGLGPRLPRHGLVDRFCSCNLASEFLVGKALANDCADPNVKAFRVGHLAVVESPSLFVDVAEQVKRLNADIGPV